MIRRRARLAVQATVSLVALAAFGTALLATAQAAPARSPGLEQSFIRRLASDPAGGAITARIVGWAAVRARPGFSGRVFTHVGPLTSWSREPQVLLVLGTALRDGQEWLRVLLGIRPDGSSGWIPRNDVVLATDPYWIQVDKTTRTVTVTRDGRVMLRAEAVIGKAATPTPDGIAAVWESDPQPSPNDFLGPWAMPLTVLSRVLQNFGGGPGRIAIHGRGGSSLLDPLGSAASHGCIRIDNSAIEWMASHIKPGTPVDITGSIDS